MKGNEKTIIMQRLSGRWSTDRLRSINMYEIKIPSPFQFCFHESTDWPQSPSQIGAPLFHSSIQILLIPIAIANINYDIGNSFHLSHTHTQLLKPRIFFPSVFRVVIIHSISCRIRRETIDGQIISLLPSIPVAAVL